MDAKENSIFTPPSFYIQFERKGMLGDGTILSPDINEKMVAILVDHLMEVNKTFKLNSGTFYLTCNLVYSYLSRVENLSRDNLQEVGIVCLWIASKYMEIYAPEANDLIYITDKKYNREQLIEREQKILITLGFNVNIPVEFEMIRLVSSKYKFDIKHREHFKVLIRATKLDIKFARFVPTAVITSAAYLVTSKFNTPFINIYEIPEDVYLYVAGEIAGLCFRLQSTSLVAWKNIKEMYEGFMKDFLNFTKEVGEDKTKYSKPEPQNSYYFTKTFFKANISEAMIPYTEIKKISKLGSGSYGNVYKVKYRDTEYALKKALKELFVGEGFPSSVIREYSIISNLDNDNVISTNGIAGNGLAFLMPLAVYDLNRFIGIKHLNRSTDTDIKTDWLKSIAKQLLTGLTYIHANGCLHRDIKPHNILVFPQPNNKFTCKYSDFGSARGSGISLRDNSFTQNICTLWYRPLELLLGASAYSEELDVWSLMCVFYEVATTKPLFPGDSQIDQIYRIFRVIGTQTPETWPGIEKYPEYKSTAPKWIKKKDYFNELPELYREIIQRGLIPNPDKRPSAAELSKILN